MSPDGSPVQVIDDDQQQVRPGVGDAGGEQEQGEGLQGF
jgi:hypothetical protein